MLGAFSKDGQINEIKTKRVKFKLVKFYLL